MEKVNELKKLPVVGPAIKDVIDFPAQVRALLNKGLILQMRQYKTNLIQLLFPVVIIGLILLLQLLFELLIPVLASRDLTPPPFLLAPILLNLLNSNTSEPPPTRYLYSIDKTVDNATLGFLDRNGVKAGFLGGLPLGTGYVLYTNKSQVNFTPMAVPHFVFQNSSEDTDKILYNKLNTFGTREFMSELGAFHFKQLNYTSDKPTLEYVVQYDQKGTEAGVTDFCENVAFFGDCRAFMPNSMMGPINSMFLSRVTGGKYAIQSLTKHWPYRFEAAINFRVADALGNFFYPLILMFLLPVFMYTIVLEKQGKLREMMKLMGMKVFNYFLVTYCTFFFFYLIVLAEFLLICFIFQFRFSINFYFINPSVTGTHPLVLFLGFIGWGFSLVSWSFLLSAFIGKTLIAVVTGYLLTIFGATAGTILETFVFQPGVLWYKPLLLIHPLPLSQFINAITVACNSLRCPQIDSLIMNYDIMFPVIAMYVNAILYLILGLYFDAVLPQPWGIRKSVFFPITWMFTSCLKKFDLNNYSTDLKLDTEDEDVTAERLKVMGENPEKTSLNSPVVIKGLRKVYNARKTALHELSIAFDHNECFGLLGPNGAGKSTTISMLCFIKGTKVLMGNGTEKNIENIKSGEFVLGPDSKPKRVISTTSGQDVMYEIKQRTRHQTKENHGIEFICNSNHLLVVETPKFVSKVHTIHDKNKLFEVVEYYELKNGTVIKSRRCFDHKTYGENVAKNEAEKIKNKILKENGSEETFKWLIAAKDVENLQRDVRNATFQSWAPIVIQNNNFRNKFEELSNKYGQSVNEEKIAQIAWLLGLWLGDGSTSTTDIAVNLNDQDEHQRIYKYCNNLGLEAEKHSQPLSQKGSNSCRISIHSTKPRFTSNSKHKKSFNILWDMIQEYCKNSDGIKTIRNGLHLEEIFVREWFLAGIIDSDGCLYESDKNFNANYVEIKTVYSEIRDGLIKLSKSLGIGVSIITAKNYTDKRAINHQTSFTVRLSMCLALQNILSKCSITGEYAPFGGSKKKQMEEPNIVKIGTVHPEVMDNLINESKSLGIRTSISIHNEDEIATTYYVTLLMCHELKDKMLNWPIWYEKVEKYELVEYLYTKQKFYFTCVKIQKEQSKKRKRIINLHDLSDKEIKRLMNENEKFGYNFTKLVNLSKDLGGSISNKQIASYLREDKNIQSLNSRNVCLKVLEDNIQKIENTLIEETEKVDFNQDYYGISLDSGHQFLLHNNAIVHNCGLFGPSMGTAYVNQFDIRTDIDSVHLALGLCPQFDIQWDDLTVQEHLEFYARLKGMPILEERRDVKKILDSVGLWEKRSRKTGQLSGGMRRRLSIAIAFVGDPKIVMLDEPTTGLDPTSKRHLWDSILKAKQGRCIILTTHSMEEADVLCDRIGIVCRGRLQCVASSQRLKNKFGEGFNLGINFKEGYREQAVEYIKSVIPEAKIHVEFKTNIIYEIEKQYVKVSKIFKQVELEKEKVGIVDWALSQTTLEDVFLNIVRKDEIQAEKEFEAEKKMLTGGLGRDALFDTTTVEQERSKSDLELQDQNTIHQPVEKTPETRSPRTEEKNETEDKQPQQDSQQNVAEIEEI